MKLFIVTMDDPLYTIPFFKEIIDVRKKDIIGLAVAHGDRLKIGKKRSKFVYLISLILIMGVKFFIQNSAKTLVFKVKKRLSKKYQRIKSPSIIEYARHYGIKTYEINSPNEKEFVQELEKLNPDIIINQSQHILKKEFLKIPKIGTLNRHNALLPKNRGRLTPFWVLYKKEKETGVSIHFIDEGIDSGAIVVQEKYQLTSKDNFKSVVTKNYQLAAKAMLKALTLIESGDYKTIPNSQSLATYNSVPSFRDALNFRIQRIFNK